MWEYRAAPLRAVDGDTVRLLVDVGFHARLEIDVRLAGVMAPELDEPGGPEAAQFTARWLDAAMSPDRRWPLLVRTQTTTVAEPEERRSFTRYIGRIWRLPEAVCLNDDVTAFLDRS
jgi:endonuclease YncB( thermonuclease family)